LLLEKARQEEREGEVGMDVPREVLLDVILVEYNLCGKLKGADEVLL